MSILKDTLIRTFLPPKGEALETRAISSKGGYNFSASKFSTNSRGLDFGPDDPLTGRQASEVDYRCYELWASELASRPLVLEGKEGIVEDDPVAVRFNKSSGDAESSVMRKRITYAKMEKKGEAFVYMDRGEKGDGEPKDFIVLMDPVEPLIAENFYEDDGVTIRARTTREKIAPMLAGFVVHTEFGDVPLLPSEVLWLRYPDFERPWQPMAPGSFAELPAMLDHEARQWQIQELKQGARPGGFLNLGEGTTEENAQRYKAQLEAQASGPQNAGRWIVTGGSPGDKPKYDRMALTPQEMSYIESHGMNGRDICTAYGIPVDLIFGQSTFDNQDAAWTRFWSTAASKLTLISSEIDRQLYPDDARTAIFDVRDVAALQENTDAIHARAKESWLADGITLKEYRAAITAEPLEDNDPRNEMTYTQLLNSYKQPVPAALQADPLAEGTAPNLTLVPDATDEELAAARAAQYKRNMDVIKAEQAEGRALSIDWDKLDGDLAAGIDKVAPVGEKVLVDPPKPRTALSPKRTLAAYDRHEKAVKLAIVRLAEKQQAAVLRAVKKEEGKRSKVEGRAEEPPLDPTTVFDPEYWQAQTVLSLSTSMEAVAVDAVLSTAEALGQEATDAFLQSVADAMQSRLQILAGQITQTTYEIIRDEILKPGVEKGESIPKLAKRLTDRFTDLKTWRAEMISRTEVLSGTNQASFDFNVESGLVKATTWQATPDERTRVSHRDMDGETVPLGETFSNGLRFPGDPLGLPKETIQCRCVVTAVLKDDA